MANTSDKSQRENKNAHYSKTSKSANDNINTVSLEITIVIASICEIVVNDNGKKITNRDYKL